MSLTQSLASPAEAKKTTSTTFLVSKSSSQFRPLVPKESQKPLVLVSSRLAQYKPIPCRVCGKLRCGLSTHREYGKRVTTGAHDKASRQHLQKNLEGTPFTQSYSYGHFRYFVDRDIAASQIDPFFHLPISERHNMRDVSELFVQCQFPRLS